MIAEYSVTLENKTKSELIMLINELQDMLKEKDKEIKNKKKSLDNLENELNRLSERNLELFEESFEAQKKNEYWESRIKQGRKDVKGLKLYEIGIVCEDLKEEIEKKDKMIDLMLESIELQQYANIDTTDLDLICKDIKCNKKCTIIKKECIYKHFERKANNETK